MDSIVEDVPAGRYVTCNYSPSPLVLPAFSRYRSSIVGYRPGEIRAEITPHIATSLCLFYWTPGKRFMGLINSPTILSVQATPMIRRNHESSIALAPTFVIALY